MTYFIDVIDVEEFRTAVHEFLAARYPLRDPLADDDRVDIIARTHDHDAAVEAARHLQRELAAGGFAGVQLPTEYGGQGLSRTHAKAVDAELASFDAPSLRPLGIGMHLAAPTLLAAGTEEQKRRYLPPLIAGDERWCQLFSEPDAGSDLVSLRTRAVRDGDQWVIDGQKVWSSYAADAEFGLLLARTDPDAAKPHAGITMFILPMTSAGVTVRPLVDIAGGRHFNEVFLEGVRLDAGAVLGDVNLGWGVSQGTLGGERSGYMGGSGGGRRHRQLLSAADVAGRRGDAVVRQRLAALVSAERILEWTRDRYQQGVLAGGHPAAGSMMKLAAGTLEQSCAELVSDLMGMAGCAWDASDPDGDVTSHSLNVTRQATIAGGTHQIQRNLLGERVLGLPREPK